MQWMRWMEEMEWLEVVGGGCDYIKWMNEYK